MYAGTRDGRLITIKEIAAAYRISRTHLMKVCHQLTRAGLLRAVRGRSGGLALAKAPSEIGIGEVLRLTEPDFVLVDCFGGGGGGCTIARHCRLQGVLHEALGAFLATIDRYTVADLILNPEDFGIALAAR
jgi:Rrf2 family nitric oxide-sensitive transcriptional repressor